MMKKKRNFGLIPQNFGLFPAVKPWLVSQLKKMLHNQNQYMRDFKTAMESVPKRQEFKSVIHSCRFKTCKRTQGSV